MKRRVKGSTVRVTDRQRRAKFSLFTIKRFAKAVLAHSRKQVELHVVFVSDSEIRRLNRLYHGTNRPTDVLAFEKPSAWPSLPAEKPLLGEIIISVDRAFAYAKRYHVSVSEELLRYLVHGILHLLGERDEKLADQKKMIRKQEELLNRLRPRGKVLLQDGNYL